MKRKLMVLMVVLAAGVFSVRAQSTEQKLADNKAQISIADARSRIDKAIETPAVMTAVMQHLSAEDQKQFLADVNKAVSDLPASVEEKSAKFLNVNHAALKGAAKGNVSTLIAEVFATVPPEALTVINERFAADLLSRTADSSVTYTDEQFAKIATDLMAKVSERCEEVDNAEPRCAFAMLMLLRASNGTPADLGDKLIETLKTDEAKEMARTEWIPSALGKDDRPQSYESILASCDAGRRPDLGFVMEIAGPQVLETLLFDLNGKNTDPKAPASARNPAIDAVQNTLRHTIPMLGADLAEQTTVRPTAGSNIVVGPDGQVIPNPPPGTVVPTPEPEPEPEPEPYQWQRIR